MGLASALQAWRRRGAHSASSLKLTPGGFALGGGETTTMIAWPEIIEVTAFKRDLMTVDLMCLLIRTNAALVELDEEMPGYAAVEDAMHEALNISIAWKIEVMFPAFETKATRIFPGSPEPLMAKKAA